MDRNRFDDLARVLSGSDSRRRVLGLVATLPAVGALLDLLTLEEAEAKDRRRRRKQRHNKRKNPGNRAGTRKRKKSPPTCTPTTCAAQGKTCGSLPDGCGKTLDCGPCTCATGCHPDCQTCNRDTGLCDNVANDTPCDDGDVCTQTDTCQNGVCVGSNPVVCPNPDQCHEPGVCNPATGLCSNPNKVNGTPCNDGDACTSGETCSNGTCGGGSFCANPPPCRTTVDATCNGTTCTYPTLASAGTSCTPVDGNTPDAVC